MEERLGTKKLTVLQNGRVRSSTVAAKPLSVEEMKEVGAINVEDYDRPSTREECKAMERPCPFVSCVHHLYIDVNEDIGSIKFNFPHLEVWEMAETCSLDVADRGGVTLEEVGAILNLTRERIRQVEVRGLARLKSSKKAFDLDIPPATGDSNY